MLKLLIPLLAVVVLGACASGAPRVRINPPVVSLQELRQDGDACTVLVRVHNHSSVIMRYTSLRFDRIEIDGRGLDAPTLEPDLDVPPYSAEPFSHALDCAGLADQASELVYHLAGRIQADQPRNQGFNFSHRSRLLPVPGLDGVYR